MRVIKFRVWHNGKKEWVHPPGIEPNILGELILMGEFCRSVRIEELNDLLVLQYTGLKDKNGKEIYEGDIVTYQQPYRASRLTHPATTDSYRTIKAPVIYNQDKFNYEIDRYALGTPMIKSRKDIEVIGNIYENPELIKQSC